MAFIQLGTADGSILGNPTAGDFYIFMDSNNSNQLTSRDSAGTDIVYGAGGGVGDMLAATYDPTGQANDVYDYAHALGVTQITTTIITPATLTATANDYNPTGFADCNMIRQDIDANNRQITGFVAPSVGVNRIIRINNLNTSGFDLRFQHNDAGSVAANRLLLRDDANKSIKPNETAGFWYDHTSSRWRPLGRVG